MRKPRKKISTSEKRKFFKRVKENLGPKVVKYYKWFFRENGWSRFVLGMNNQELKLWFKQVKLAKGRKFCLEAA